MNTRNDGHALKGHKPITFALSGRDGVLISWGDETIPSLLLKKNTRMNLNLENRVYIYRIGKETGKLVIQ